MQILNARFRGDVTLSKDCHEISWDCQGIVKGLSEDCHEVVMGLSRDCHEIDLIDQNLFAPLSNTYYNK